MCQSTQNLIKVIHLLQYAKKVSLTPLNKQKHESPHNIQDDQSPTLAANRIFQRDFGSELAEGQSETPNPRTLSTLSSCMPQAHHTYLNLLASPIGTFYKQLQ